MERPTSWSYSAWSTYDTCPRKYYYHYIEKLPQPDTPALANGKRVHKLAEDYVAGRLNALPVELGKFVGPFEDLRALEAVPEREIILSSEWVPISNLSEKWLKCILDAAIVYPDGTADIVDYKTGRAYPTHSLQMQLYALALMSAEPGLKTVTTRLWYLDSGEETKDTMLAAASCALQSLWSKRAQIMLADVRFQSSPGRWCRWCPQHIDAGGPCRGNREER